MLFKNRIKLDHKFNKFYKVTFIRTINIIWMTSKSRICFVKNFTILSNRIKTCLQICLSFIVCSCTLLSKVLLLLRVISKKSSIPWKFFGGQTNFHVQGFFNQASRTFEILDFFLDLICFALSSGRGDSKNKRLVRLWVQQLWSQNSPFILHCFVKPVL